MKRIYCNPACSAVGRSLRAKARAKEQDLRDSPAMVAAHDVEFSRADILRVAHMAAPQIPITLIADVVDRTEPLIAATTRHRLMRYVARATDQYRDPDGTLVAPLGDLHPPTDPPVWIPAEIEESTPAPEPCPLTERELGVVAAMSEGHSATGAATVLFIAPNTVKSHLRRITRRLDAKSTTHVVAIALRAGWIA